MYIKNNNIDDFCTMITTCVLNGTDDIRVFISEEKSYPNVSISSTPKNHVKFTYVLLTPLYTAIYSDNILNSEYNRIYKNLENCQDNACEHKFRIQIFDKIHFDIKNNCLTIGKETNVI